MIIFKMVAFCLNMNGFIFTWFDFQCANPGWTLSICFSSLAYWAEWACTNKDKALTNTTTKTMTKTNAYKTVWQVLFLIEQTELLSSAPMVFSINPPPLWYNKEWWHWDRMMLNIQWSSPLMVSSTHFQHELQFFLHFFSSRGDFQFLEKNYYILHSWMQLLDMGLQTQNINQKCFVFRNLLSVQKKCVLSLL